MSVRDYDTHPTVVTITTEVYVYGEVDTAKLQKKVHEMVNDEWHQEHQLMQVVDAVDELEMEVGCGLNQITVDIK